MKYIITFCAILGLINLTGQSSIEVQFIQEEDHAFSGAAEVLGLENKLLHQLEKNSALLDREHGIFQIFPLQEEAEAYGTLPSMLGKMTLEQERLFFVPRFPFLPGRKYLIRFHHQRFYDLLDLSDPQKESFSFYDHIFLIPDLNTHQPTEIVQIYPTTNNWPANQLKFYLYFSAPMRLGEAAAHILLLDEDGKIMDAPFLEIGQELWDKQQQRLTIWFDPGRIKRGLIPNKKKGAPLQASRNYTLLIKKEWRDVHGKPLAQDYQKELKIGSKDQHIPNPKDWNLIVDKQRLQLRFPEPMDHALLQGGMGVIHENGQVIEGQIQTFEEEKRWIFIPQEPLPKGNYILRISTDLEDLAGNNLVRLFDVDVDKKGAENTTARFIDLPFKINL